jgi:ParB-like nuclease domain
MNIEIWPISRPIPYARNARKITAQAVDKVAASLKEFGWQQPIVVDSEAVVIAGHTRLLAAQKLGLTHVPVHVATELTPAQVRAYRLTDNRSHQETGWDMPMLGVEMSELAELGVAELTGFDAAEIEKLLVTPDDDENYLDPTSAADDTGSEKTEKVMYIKWTAVVRGKFKEMRAPITSEESDQLTDKWNLHVEDSGLGYGFVRRLLERGE